MGEGVCGRPAARLPGQGQMKPEQLEIERLRREVHKLKAERDPKKGCGLLRASSYSDERISRPPGPHTGARAARDRARRSACRHSNPSIQTSAARSSTHSRPCTKDGLWSGQRWDIPIRPSCNRSRLPQIGCRCERQWSSTPHALTRQGSAPRDRSSTAWTGEQRRLWILVPTKCKELICSLNAAPSSW